VPENRTSLYRRKFINAAAVLASLAPFDAIGRNASIGAGMPFVDGLCTDVLRHPGDIERAGLAALMTDISAVEQVAAGDGSPRWKRSFAATVAAIGAARQALADLPGAFLATDGRQTSQLHRAGRTAVFLQVQGGGEIVGDDLGRINVLHELGLRILQITHHDNNPLGGGSMVKVQSGLTRLGFEALERLDALGVIPDLSHASDRTAADTLRASKRPVILSHGAARAIVNNARCSPDDIIRGIAESGGVMGIFMMSFWLTDDDTPTVDAYIRQIRHVIKIGGIDAVGIANDFPLTGEPLLNRANGNNADAVKAYFQWWDGMAAAGVLGFERRPKHVAIPELNNISRMHTLQRAFEKGGFRSADIEKIMGGNWIRVLGELRA
jgi:membrane dipeptidase